MQNLTDELLLELSQELVFDEVKTFTLQSLIPKDNNKILSVLYSRTNLMECVLATITNCLITQRQSSLILTRASLINILKNDTNHSIDGFKSETYPLIVKQLSKFFTVSKVKNNKREVIIITLSNIKLINALGITSTQLQDEFLAVRKYIMGERTNSNQYNSVYDLIEAVKQLEDEKKSTPEETSVVKEPVIASFKLPVASPEPLKEEVAIIPEKPAYIPTFKRPVVRPEPLKEEVVTTLPTPSVEPLKTAITSYNAVYNILDRVNMDNVIEDIVSPYIIHRLVELVDKKILTLETIEFTYAGLGSKELKDLVERTVDNIKEVKYS